jgi:hypothetical protein
MPIGDTKAKKCLLCTNLVKAKKLEIRKHLNEVHQMANAKTCAVCGFIYKSKMEIMSHGCEIPERKKTVKKEPVKHKVTIAIPTTDATLRFGQLKIRWFQKWCPG